MATICTNCGGSNQDSALVCANCGARLNSPAALAESVRKVDQVTHTPWGSYILLAVGAIYLLNPFFGIDLIPDNLPIIGNLDEAGIAFMMFYIANNLGWLKLPGGPKPPTSGSGN
jgi:hypothetical protein